MALWNFVLSVDSPWKVAGAIVLLAALVVFVLSRVAGKARGAPPVQRIASPRHGTLVEALAEADRPLPPPPPSGDARRDRLRLATPFDQPWHEAWLIKQLYETARAEGLHVDHVVPLAPCRACGRRGLHRLDNLQLLTPEDNLAKGNRCHRCWTGEW